MKNSGAEVLVQVLEENEIRYVFGIPGGHLLKFYDSIYRSNLVPILTKHESGASFMATGHAQVSGGIGACAGTVGPGATNLVTGVASAYMDSIPLLVVTAQVGTGAVGKGALQEATGEGRTIDHVELFDGVTKYSTRVFSIDKLEDACRNALRLAVNGDRDPYTWTLWPKYSRPRSIRVHPLRQADQALPAELPSGVRARGGQSPALCEESCHFSRSGGHGGSR